MKFTHRFRVSARDIDQQGHVNNVAYVRWIQEVAVAHWRYTAAPEMLDRFSWIVVRHEIDYKKQAFVNEEIITTTWVGEWSRVTCERFTEMHRGHDLLVKSRTLWCMVERISARPARIGPELRSLFTPDPDF